MRSRAARARTVSATTLSWSRTAWVRLTPLVWLMADQGIFAVTNFITGILFARWLTPTDFGLFAVSYSGYLLLTVFHYGAILEPMLVQSAKVEATRLRSYIVVLIVGHVILIGGISVLATLGLIIARLLGSPNTGLAIIGAAIGGSLMVTLLTARRLCLVFLSTRVSAVIGIVYMLGVIGTTYLIYRYSVVSWFDLWLITGAWSLLCSIIIFLLLYVSLTGSQGYTLAALCRFQWHYARYGVVAAVCSWCRTDGALLMLAHFAGLTVIAETRAVLNLCNPLIQVNMALATSWLVAFSRDHSWLHLRQTALVYTVIVTPVIIIAFMIATPLVSLVYSGRYVGGASIFPFFLIAQAIAALEMLCTCLLKAVGALRRGYLPQVVGCAISLGVGILVIPSMGEAGFIVAVMVSFVVGAALAFSLVQVRRHVAA